MRPRTLRNNKGFTLIELMIVVVIIGILAALAIPRFGNASARAKEKEAEGIVKSIYTMQNAYYAERGSFATSMDNLRLVGWEAPTPTNYVAITNDHVTHTNNLTGCLNPVGAPHRGKRVNLQTGAITEC
jgi:prepilin-type N-terminal cleavage/methylation domain-containing protein